MNSPFEAVLEGTESTTSRENLRFDDDVFEGLAGFT
jgi:hypothetical protein